MPEKPGPFRTTISVPTDLKTRMDRVGEPVNWSALACQAFENKLAEIAAGKENKTMADVIERLRASMRDEQGTAFKDGYQTGTEWGEKTATAAELRRLESFQISTKKKSQEYWKNWFWPQGKHLPWLALVGVIQDDQNIRPLTGAAFWKALVGEPSPKPISGDFLRGFVEGAVDLWSTVKEQL